MVHILSGLMVFVLYRSRKPTAVTRCMCPLYDTNRQAWIELQPMSIARFGHGVVAAGQCLESVILSSGLGLKRIHVY